MTIRDGQPSPAQARMMAKVFIIATVLGGLAVFLNVSMRSYNIRMQQQAAKEQQAAPGAPAPATQAPQADQAPASAPQNP